MRSQAVFIARRSAGLRHDGPGEDLGELAGEDEDNGADCFDAVRTRGS